jgi:hypothetical protein
MKSEFIDIDELLLIIKKKDKAPYFCPNFTEYFGQVFLFMKKRLSLSEIYRIFRTDY